MSGRALAWRASWCARAFAATLGLAGCSPSNAASGSCEPARLTGQGIPLSRCPVPAITILRPTSDGSRQVTRVGNVSTDPSRSCLTRRAFWWVAEGRLLRAALPGGEVSSVLGAFRGEHPMEPTGVACDGEELVFTATLHDRDTDRVDLVARLRDDSTHARVIWSDRALRDAQPSPRWPSVAGDLVTWSWDFTVPTLWAQRGAAAPLTVRADLHASTPPAAGPGWVVYPSGTRLERWSPPRQTARLAPGDGDQWSPVTAGGWVAWIDQRDEPRGTARTPRNPQVYVMPPGGAARRVSVGARRGWRGHPSLSEGWLVWVDTRNDPVPDREPGAWVRAEVFGARLPQATERPLATQVVAALPRVQGDTLYYLASSEGPRLDLFARPLPRD